ncbi:hypothetical protein Gdia_0558 [Gluconacetobacter diazotrophicus PA1 5]|uniref:hypothetical protein n=1 Tax=Gluconacetobacter diazotrophicus TaxID=33996 RepID=UPI000173B3C1|nr:hypothetical protein [Gluconacetobacter diazotrophicus]ACI50351.1 hypothetical protein Gdia_0558 [Gluconacetobacter diazotrophicus PA1 5]
MQSITFVSANFNTGQPGSPWTGPNAQLVYDELNNVLAIAGITPNGTNSQVATALTDYFAPLASPGLTGSPTAPTPAQGDDSTHIATTAFVQTAVSSAELPYTPVRQGTGSGQGSNTISIGLSTDGTDQLLAQYDSTPMGPLALRDYTDATYLKLTGGSLSGALSVSGTITGTGDIHTGSGNTLYTNNINAPSGTLSITGSNLTTTGSLTVGGSIYGSSNVVDIMYGTSNGWKSAFQNDGSFAIYNPSGTNIFSVGGSDGDIVTSMPMTVNNSLYAYNSPPSGDSSTQVPNTEWVDNNFYSLTKYNSDFSTSNGGVINLPWNNCIQAWSFDLVTSGYTANVNFPVAFSAGPFAISIESCAGDMDTWTNNWSATGFTINVPDNSATTNGNISVIAIGPR